MRLSNNGRGSGQDLADALNTRISELDGGIVENCHNINYNSEAVMSDTEVWDAYIEEIENRVEDQLENEVDSVTFQDNEDALIVTVVYMDYIRKYDVPKADLTMDIDNVDQDVSYIVNTIFEDLDTME